MGHSATAHACASVGYHSGCASRVTAPGCPGVCHVQGKSCVQGVLYHLLFPTSDVLFHRVLALCRNALLPISSESVKF